jgi:hypothetical protein
MSTKYLKEETVLLEDVSIHGRQILRDISKKSIECVYEIRLNTVEQRPLASTVIKLTVQLKAETS